MTRLFTISPALDFLPTLVESLKGGQIFGSGVDFSDPVQLADLTLLLPNRRSALLLGQKWLEWWGTSAAVLPKIRAIGDDDDGDWQEPSSLIFQKPIDPLSRRLLLMPLVRKWLARNSQRDIHTSDGAQLALVDELAHVLDALATERIGVSALQNIVPQTWDRYWQESRDFLEIIASAWPQLLQERGFVDAAQYRDANLTHFAQRVLAPSFRGYVVIAGSTGSIPATRDLMGVVAQHARGAVVFPGFDADMPALVFNRLLHGAHDAGACAHPQSAMTLVLQSLQAHPSDVRELGSAPALQTERCQDLHLALDLAETSATWAAHSQTLNTHSWDGVTIVEAQNGEEEALVIALKIKQTLTEPHKTVLLITPDRALVQRVQAALRRFDIECDDSAGMMLKSTLLGSFSELIAVLRHRPDAPALRSLLLHPFFAFAEHQKQAAQNLIACVLHGRAFDGWDGLHARIMHLQEQRLSKHSHPAIKALDDLDLEQIAQLYTHLRTVFEGGAHESLCLSSHVRLHRQCLQWLGGDTLTTHQGFDALMLILERMESFDGDLTLTAYEYSQLFHASIRSEILRPARSDSSTRLQILGLPEARLMRADVAILAGLNEDLWPPAPATSPFLNRGMMMALGMSPPERRVGLAAHDFIAAMMHAEVMVTRAIKTGESPNIRSRFLERLRVVVAPAWARACDRGQEWLMLARAMDRPNAPDDKSLHPPCPPQHRRPTSYSVSSVRQLMQDPYAFFAQNILKLRPLPPMDDALSPADFGNLVHRGLELELRGMIFADEGLQLLTERMMQAFERSACEMLIDTNSFEMWRVRLRGIAAWVASDALKARPILRNMWQEERGEIGWKDAAGNMLSLSARADRIDLRHDGSVELVDYKTGAIPSNAKIKNGNEPQLMLEAAIAAQGGFGCLAQSGAGHVSRLRLIKLTGRGEGAEEGAIKHDDSFDLALSSQELLQNIQQMIEAMRQPNQPYRFAKLGSSQRGRKNDYEHLSRIHELSSEDDENDFEGDEE